MRQRQYAFVAAQLVGHFVFPSESAVHDILFDAGVYHLQISAFLFRHSLFVEEYIVLYAFDPGRQLCPCGLQVDLDSGIDLLDHVHIPVIPPEIAGMEVTHIEGRGDILDVSFRTDRRIFF